MNCKTSISLALIVGMFLVPVADAATTTANYGIQLNVLQGGSCTINNAGFSANYDSATPSDTDISPSVGITCSYGTAWTLSFDQGQNPDAGSDCLNPARRVANGASFVSYGIYSDSGYTQPVGCDPSNGLAGVGTGTVSYQQTFARIPAGQSPTATGAHTDAVVMTLTF